MNLKNIKWQKLIWQDTVKALTFSSGNTLDDLVAMYKLILKTKEKKIRIDTLKLGNKSKAQLLNLIERLCMLGEIFKPYVRTSREDDYIRVI